LRAEDRTGRARIELLAAPNGGGGQQKGR
jgi:hypothetical protein